MLKILGYTYLIIQVLAFIHCFYIYALPIIKERLFLSKIELKVPDMIKKTNLEKEISFLDKMKRNEQKYGYREEYAYFDTESRENISDSLRGITGSIYIESGSSIGSSEAWSAPSPGYYSGSFESISEQTTRNAITNRQIQIMQEEYNRQMAEVTRNMNQNIYSSPDRVSVNPYGYQYGLSQQLMQAPIIPLTINNTQGEEDEE